MPGFRTPLRALLYPLLWLALVGPALPVAAAPFLPGSDDQVLERVPSRAGDKRVR